MDHVGDMEEELGRFIITLPSQATRMVGRYVKSLTRSETVQTLQCYCSTAVSVGVFSCNLYLLLLLLLPLQPTAQGLRSVVRTLTDHDPKAESKLFGPSGSSGCGKAPTSLACLPASRLVVTGFLGGLSFAASIFSRTFESVC